MINLLKKLGAYSKCIGCGKKKPMSDFRLLSKEKAVYDKICKACRQIEEDEDDGGGGKQHKLALGLNAKKAIKKNQTEAKDAVDEAKETYLEKTDKLHQDDLKEKAGQQDLINRKKRFFDRTLDLLKKTKDPATLTDKQKETLSTEFGFDPDKHDPMRQIPVAEHHHIFMTHPDRMDVKFLLEYTLSGDYAQAHTHLIGAAERHAARSGVVYTAQNTSAPTGVYSATNQTAMGINADVSSATPQSINTAQLNQSAAQYNAQAVNSPTSTLLAQSLVAVGATSYLATQAQHPVAPIFLNQASPGMFNQSNIAATGFSGEVARDIAVNQRSMANPAYFQFARTDTTEEVMDTAKSEEQAQKVISYMSQTWK